MTETGEIYAKEEIEKEKINADAITPAKTATARSIQTVTTVTKKITKISLIGTLPKVFKVTQSKVPITTMNITQMISMGLSRHEHSSAVNTVVDLCWCWFSSGSILLIVIIFIFNIFNFYGIIFNNKLIIFIIFGCIKLIVIIIFIIFRSDFSC